MYFKKIKSTIEQCAKEENVKPLGECKNTIEALKKEKEGNNPYIKLAKRFKKYNSGYKETSKDQDAIDDWLFYKYLSNLPSTSQYEFPLAENKTIIVEIDLLNPYIYVESEGREFIDPRWHFLVSYLAYKDAIFNHKNDEYAKNIKGKYITEGLSFRKNLKIWTEEAIKSL